MQDTLTFEELIGMRNALMVNQQRIYITAISNINMRYSELLKNDFGSTLVRNCAWDIADTLVTEYFDTGDFYISPQQVYDRIVHFSYDDKSDPFLHNDAIRKALYSSRSSKETIREITSSCQKAQAKLFEKQADAKGRKDYIDKKKITAGKDAYERRFVEKHHQKIDDLSGVTESDGFKIERDHVQPLATASYDSRYITGERIEELKDFYTSDKNLQMLNKSANASKGDVRVYWDGEKAISEKTFVSERKEAISKFKHEYMAQGINEKEATDMATKRAERYVSDKFSDITYKATAKERADAICDQWEHSSASQNLQESKILDENGKVPPKVREELERRLRESMDEESSRMVLPYYVESDDGTREKRGPLLDYKEISKDAQGYTKSSIKKILMGQVIYYVLPPLVFETQSIIKRKNTTLEQSLKELKQSGKRVVKYVVSKLGEIFKNIAGNTLNKFLKSFFDIIIEAVKETVKKLVKIAKKLVLSLVSCVRTIAGKGSAAEKADAVTKTLAVSVTTVALEVLFEWAEEQYQLPDIVMEPLQIIVTILSTNLIMLILQKADLFDVQYGLLVSNIELAFREEYENYLEQTQTITTSSEEKMSMYFRNLTKEIQEIETSIESLNLFEDDATQSLNKLNEIYNMGIDFDREWSDYLART